MERSFGAWLSEFIDWMLTLKSFFPFSATASLSFSFLKPAGTKRRVMTQKKLVSRECWWWKDFVELVVASNAQFSTEESLLCWASDSCECNSLCNIHQLYRLTLLEFLIDVKMWNLIKKFLFCLYDFMWKLLQKDLFCMHAWKGHLFLKLIKEPQRGFRKPIFQL